MKNRKTVVVAFLLVAVMLLGVGYATLTNTLNITADLKADPSKAGSEFDGDVYFSNKNIDKDDTNHASCIIENNDLATITADMFTTANQEVVVTLTITNDSTDFDAVLTPDVSLDAAHDGIFAASCVWEGTDNLNQKTIPAGGSANLTVTLKLLKTPDEAHQAKFTVDFEVKSAEAAG